MKQSLTVLQMRRRLAQMNNILNNHPQPEIIYQPLRRLFCSYTLFNSNAFKLSFNIYM